MKNVLLLIMVILLFTGCSNAGEDKQRKDDNMGSQAKQTAEASETKKGFFFEYQGVTIPMNVDAAPIVEKLGETVDYFEAASCAFQGLDKIYYYQGFEMGIYPNGKKDYVSYVNLLDDSVTTEKGICLGSSLEEVIVAYGSEYSAEGTSYVYRLGESKLTFIIEEDSVTQITYAAIVAGLNN